MMTLLAVFGAVLMIVSLAGLGWILAAAVMNAAPLSSEDRAELDRRMAESIPLLGAGDWL